MPKCGLKCEVFSRVVGYFRPVANWNKGKQGEFRDRKLYRPGSFTQAGQHTPPTAPAIPNHTGDQPNEERARD